jgi:hypothetical protein
MTYIITALVWHSFTRYLLLCCTVCYAMLAYALLQCAAEQRYSMPLCLYASMLCSHASQRLCCSRALFRLDCSLAYHRLAPASTCCTALGSHSVQPVPYQCLQCGTQWNGLVSRACTQPNRQAAHRQAAHHTGRRHTGSHRHTSRHIARQPGSHRHIGRQR